jgi:ATP-dependent RNA helicase RhlE
MNAFNEFNLNKQLLNAIAELGFTEPTPVQKEAFPIITSGKDVVGISQTGTGKTMAYLLPLLQEHKFRKSDNPRIIILVPTRELVVQVVEMTKELCKYMTIRILGVYGGTNINTQKKAVLEGVDILVGTPGRLFDLATTKTLQLSEVKKLVIDEVDVMLDEGFRPQLENLFDIMPEKRQNIMFSATMTDEVDELIEDFFVSPERINIAVSGTRLENIAQRCFNVVNFYTKRNLLAYLLNNKEEFVKVLVFVSSKRHADLLFESLEDEFGEELAIIHSNKSQNYRLEAVKAFDEGTHRILIATDVIARGLDFEKVSHVINFDVPHFAENYLHRIGRSGRAKEKGKTILFFTDKEIEAKEAVEDLMNYKIPQVRFPAAVEIATRKIEEERINKAGSSHKVRKAITEENAAFHERIAKNSKINLGSKYKREPKYHKNPLRRGDKIQNMASKKRKGK